MGRSPWSLRLERGETFTPLPSEWRLLRLCLVPAHRGRVTHLAVAPAKPNWLYQGGAAAAGSERRLGGGMWP
jgi:hypothetical protein